MKDALKKVLLAGIGGAAITAEKSKEFFDEMVKRGHVTVEQGKILNEELKQSIKKAGDKAEEKAENMKEDGLKKLVLAMDSEDIEKLKKLLNEMEDEDN